MRKTLSGRLRELKNKGKVHLSNSITSRGRLRELFITKFKFRVQTGFHKGGRNYSWSLTRVVAGRASTEFVELFSRHDCNNRRQYAFTKLFNLTPVT